MKPEALKANLKIFFTLDEGIVFCYFFNIQMLDDNTPSCKEELTLRFKYAIKEKSERY